jgi:hypothetical protein
MSITALANRQLNAPPKSPTAKNTLIFVPAKNNAVSLGAPQIKASWVSISDAPRRLKTGILTLELTTFFFKRRTFGMTIFEDQ